MFDWRTLLITVECSQKVRNSSSSTDGSGEGEIKGRQSKPCSAAGRNAVSIRKRRFSSLILDISNENPSARASSTASRQMANKRNVLVIGATGKQGRGVIHALLRPPASALASEEVVEYHILALTRNASAAHARNILASEQDHAEHLTLVEGDLGDAKSIRKIFEDASPRGGVWGVFVVLAYPGLGKSAAAEEKEGKVGRGYSRAA